MEGDYIELGSDNTAAWRKITISHGLTKLGSKAWEFCIPLFLLSWSPNLIYPAIFGLTMTVSKLLVSPSLGRWADRDSASRLQVVKIGTGMQAVAVCGSASMLIFDRSTPLFIGILACGVVECIFSGLTLNAVKKDWVPQIAQGSADLTEINVGLSRLDLFIEMLGPLWASFVIDAFGESGYVIVGLINCITYVPEVMLLRSVYYEKEHALGRRSIDGPKKTTIEASSEKTKKGGIVTFFTHPYGACCLAIGYALMWFTALSPHGVVLTSYLKLYGVSVKLLAVFRGCGAMAGVLGAQSLKWYAGGSSPKHIQMASMHYSWFLSVCVLFALISYQDNLEIFLSTIVLSRIGLYGFDLGLSTVQQVVIEEEKRMFMGAAEQALCSCGTSAVFLGSMIWSRPDQFHWLVICSTAFVWLGSIVYTTWARIWRWVPDADSTSKHLGRFERQPCF